MCMPGELCADCLLRPAVRLSPSPRATRAFWLALAGLHCAGTLLPFAVFFALRELEAIGRGDAPKAGRPWVHAALALSVLGVVMWVMAFTWWLQHTSD